MKALILAAGYGSRLGRITENLPKPLVEVKGKPVIDYIIHKLMNLGIDEIFINTHYKHLQIQNFIENAKYGIKIKIVYEPVLLGTLGTLRNLIDEISTEDFIVLHADNYFKDDLELLLNEHLSDSTGNLVTMGTFEVSNPENFGTVELSESNIVTKFFEKDKNSPSLIANSAIYCMKPEIKVEIKLSTDHENDISLHLIPKLVGKIRASALKGYFYDIGTLDNLTNANNV
jgi:mannose-1-phosphate guanylyltransferase